MQHYYHKRVCKSFTIASTPFGFASNSAEKFPLVKSADSQKDHTKCNKYPIASPNTRLSGEAASLNTKLSGVSASPNKHFFVLFTARHSECYPCPESLPPALCVELTINQLILSCSTQIYLSV